MDMVPKNYDKKIYRILAIIKKLSHSTKVYSAKLAKEFNVTIRSVQRDIELMVEVGLPITSPEKGAYSFVEGFSLKGIKITEEEAALLSTVYDVAKSLGGDFQKSFKDLFFKIVSRPGPVESPYYIKIPEGQKFEKEFPFATDLRSAIEESRMVELSYDKGGPKLQWLKVHPLKIGFFEGFWYLVSRVNTKDWILKLRLDKIKKVKVLASRFEAPENLKTLLDESVSAWFSEKRDKKITLRIDKEAAPYFKRKDHFPLQKIKKEEKDGSLTLESEVCQYMEAIPTILRWMPLITVVEPVELRKEVEVKVKEYLQKVLKT